MVYSQRLYMKEKQFPNVVLGRGVLSFDGDIGNGLDLTSLSKVKGAFNLTIEQRFGQFVGISFNEIYGKIADSERGAKRNLNFESKIFQSDLNIVFHLDNGVSFKRSFIFAPYVYTGFGFLKFNSYGDLKNKDGIKYNYWSDGTIRSVPEDSLGSKILRRDYTYETKLNDSAKYKNSALSFPIGIGVSIKIIDKVYINLGASYYFTTTDWIDNFKTGRKDHFIFINLAFQINLGDPFDESNPIYKSVDFSALDKLDTDQDGVKDDMDVCPGTPQNVKVTLNGCPVDSDDDGVPNYLDEEPQSKPGANVDANGVTLTEKMISESQQEFSAAATERSNLFNENPSLKNLKEIEAQTISARKNNPKGANTIPNSLKYGDLNNDGYISAEELVVAIDGFFEGGSTVEKLNELIDFFFDQ